MTPVDTSSDTIPSLEGLRPYQQYLENTVLTVDCDLRVKTALSRIASALREESPLPPHLITDRIVTLLQNRKFPSALTPAQVEEELATFTFTSTASESSPDLISPQEEEQFARLQEEFARLRREGLTTPILTDTAETTSLPEHRIENPPQEENTTRDSIARQRLTALYRTNMVTIMRLTPEGASLIMQ